MYFFDDSSNIESLENSPDSTTIHDCFPYDRMTTQPETSLASLLSADAIVRLHDHSTAAWHDQDNRQTIPPDGTFLKLVQAQHLANLELWHIEDRARTPQASDHELAEVKRAVDRTNQRRNDVAEQCDILLLATLEPYKLPSPTAELHSESPGLMLDRLSILALKIFHTQEEIARLNAPQGHSERNRKRLQILEAQRADLAGCLDRLWQQTIHGERRFKLYRQLKMYNDPSLNPAVYGKGSNKPG